MDIAPFIEFMLDKILRTLKAKGEAYEVGEESRVTSRDKRGERVRVSPLPELNWNSESKPSEFRYRGGKEI